MYTLDHQFSSVQFRRSVVSYSLRPHEPQHARPPCPSPTPGVYSNSCPSIGSPYSSVGQESACSTGDPGLIPGLRRSPGEGNGNPLQCPCLENLMNTGAWWAAVHGITESGTTEQLTLTYLDHTE